MLVVADVPVFVMCAPCSSISILVITEYILAEDGSCKYTPVLILDAISSLYTQTPGYFEFSKSLRWFSTVHPITPTTQNRNKISIKYRPVWVNLPSERRMVS